MQAFLKSLTVLAITVATFLNVGQAQANFLLKNHSNETITAFVMTTEIFRDGHVNQFRNVTLKPGESYDFITNDVVPGRTVNLFIHSHNSGKKYFDGFQRGKQWHWGRHRGRIIVAPYWDQPYKKRGNHYVAGEAARGNFTPLINSYPGAKMATALQITPTQGGHKGFTFIYNGINSGFGTASR